LRFTIKQAALRAGPFSACCLPDIIALKYLFTIFLPEDISA
jgi:hypothetical protein